MSSKDQDERTVQERADGAGTAASEGTSASAEDRLRQVREWTKGTLMDALGMEVVRFEPECVEITMPVEGRTRQPFGLLHGGASVALAESAASLAAWLNIDPNTQMAVGMEINANHVRPKRDGRVIATATPLHRGGRTMVWDVRIRDEAGQLICVSRCTVAIVSRRQGRDG